jgi:hypothetical protein
MFKVGDRVKLIVQYYPIDWVYDVYYESRMVAGNTEPVVTLVHRETDNYVEMYDKYVVYDEEYYRKQKLEKICSKLEK